MAKLVMTQADLTSVAEGRYWAANRKRLVTFWAAALVVLVGTMVAGERVSETLASVIMAFGMLMFVIPYVMIMLGSIKNTKAKLKEWADAEASKT